MKRYSVLILFIISVLFLQSCDREMISSGYPNVITHSAIDNGEKLVFTGEIINEDNINVDEVGFIWQNTDDPFAVPGFQVKVPQVSSGYFSTEIAWSLTNDKNYVLRAYAKCSEKVVYGDSLVFNTALIMPCKLIKIEPDSAFRGDTIRFIGQGFNQTVSNNKVLIDGKDTRIIEANDSVLICIVPNELTNGSNPVNILVNNIGGTFEPTLKLLIPPDLPFISSLSSTSIKYGGTLKINGVNLLRSVSEVVIGNTSQSIPVTPKTQTSELIEIEIYNHQDPYQMLGFSSFKVGLIGTSGIIWSDNVNIASSWTRLPDFPSSPRYKAGAFTLDGKVYIGAGASKTGIESDFWCYDPNNSRWTSKANIPGPGRVLPKGFSNSNYGYFGSGYSADNSSKVQFKDFYKYDPAGNSWTAIPDYPDEIYNFYVGYAVTVNGRPFLGLSNTVKITRELVNDTWVSLNSITEAINGNQIGVFAIGNCYYLVVGYWFDGTISNQVWEYNTETEQWKRKADFPGLPRNSGISFSVGAYGYFGCGRTVDPISQYSDMWRFDPAANSWIRVDNFPGGERSHLISCSTEQSGYAGLGLRSSSSIVYNDFWRFDP